MGFNNTYLRLRAKAVQTFDALFYESENVSKCHKRIWERSGCYIFGISYGTYMKYLKMDLSDIPPLPSVAIRHLVRLHDELLAKGMCGR